MIPRLDISFPLSRQWNYWFGKQYMPQDGEYLLNHARSGIVIALRAVLPHGGRVGVMAYNCHTVANAIVNAGCKPVFVDITMDLHINIANLPADLDALIVTNLFGIRNDIATIRKHCPNIFIIVDNAHGYGLPAEGDFSVYSINQGKFPALGPGGLLYVNKNLLNTACIDNSQKSPKTIMQYINEIYESLPGYGFIAQVNLFVQMLVKALAYSKLCYWFVRKLKKNIKPNVREQVVMKQMAYGIRRIYKAWLPNVEMEIAKQKRNAVKISELGYKTIIGGNAFMAIIRTDDIASVKAEFAKRGIESETHFVHAIDWATEFGYQRASCPNSERLTKELLMIPTYTRIEKK